MSQKEQTALQIFENPQFGKIRTVEIKDAMWFAGKDVADALGYSNTKDALASHVDKEDKRIIQRSEIATLENHIPKSVLNVEFVSADIPNRGLTFINESGLYSLILSSKLPDAKKFKHWVTSEILPTVRKHGGYITADVAKRVYSDPQFASEFIVNLVEKVLDLQGELKAIKPKADFYDMVAASDEEIPMDAMAKFLKKNGVDIGRTRLMDQLRKDKYLMRCKGPSGNAPTQKAVKAGLINVCMESFPNKDGKIVKVKRAPRVTPKGQEFFLNKYIKKFAASKQDA